MSHILAVTKLRLSRFILLAASWCLAGGLPATEVAAESLEAHLPTEIQGMIHTDRPMGVRHGIETTGKPGAPDSTTTTIDGRQLPPPPEKTFGGKIERNVVDSTPYWPPRVVPPKEIILHFVRDVDRSDLVKAWDKGFENNAGDQIPVLAERIAAFEEMMVDMESGQQMRLVHVPGTGIHVNVEGTDRGTVAGDDFAQALFSIWLGSRSANAALKAGLLGGDCE